MSRAAKEPDDMGDPHDAVQGSRGSRRKPRRQLQRDERVRGLTSPAADDVSAKSQIDGRGAVPVTFAFTIEKRRDGASWID